MKIRNIDEIIDILKYLMLLNIFLNYIFIYKLSKFFQLNFK